MYLSIRDVVQLDAFIIAILVEFTLTKYPQTYTFHKCDQKFLPDSVKKIFRLFSMLSDEHLHAKANKSIFTI